MMVNKKCELCKLPARLYCESDQASLCSGCDLKVHEANFLVARHSRRLLCKTCQAPTPWEAAGARLGNTVTECQKCVDGIKDVEEEDDDEVSAESEDCCGGSGESDDDDEMSDTEDEEEEEEEEGENQVVPWSSPSASTPPPAASSSSSRGDESSSSTSITLAKMSRKRDVSQMSPNEGDSSMASKQRRGTTAGDEGCSRSRSMGRTTP